LENLKKLNLENQQKLKTILPIFEKNTKEYHDKMTKLDKLDQKNNKTLKNEANEKIEKAQKLADTAREAWLTEANSFFDVLLNLRIEM
jgi:ATP-dependent protease ClpP protease subunit